MDQKLIIKELYKKGVLVTPKILIQIQQGFTLEQIENSIQGLEKPIEQINTSSESNIIFHLPLNVNLSKIPNSSIQIIESYDVPSKKREIRHFIRHFNVRFDQIKNILQSRHELQSLLLINKILAKQDKEEVSFIGMVQEINITKNGNILLSLEDKTGQISVLINKNKPELYNLGKELVYDEVVGITGMLGNNIVFANNVIQPSIPLNKEFKKSPDEAYMAVISDIHLGNDKCLENEFSKFIEWINGKVGNDSQKQIALKIKYLFINGDLVEGIGIYPSQEKDLVINDIYEQYDKFAEYLNQIRKDIIIVITGGNHDAMRIAEPQPPLIIKYTKKIHEMENVILVSNPALLNIHKSENFPGFDVLMYHGFSFPYYGDHVESIRQAGGMKRSDLIMQFLLERRHLAPSHGSNLYLPQEEKDPLVISTVPDFFITGHIHFTTVQNYKNITLINSSCWVTQTDYQEKMGMMPEPGRVVLINLKTREPKIIKFFQEAKHE